MSTDNPFSPVRLPPLRPANIDRPFYIYATAVVLLLWVGIYIYLRAFHKLYEENGRVIVGSGLTVQSPSNAEPVAYQHYVDLNLPAVIAVLVLSVAAVNFMLWLILKGVRQFRRMAG